MPAKSQKQADLMRAAAHGADFPKAKQLRESMSPEQLRDFAKFEGESHAYNWRSRNNLKRGHTRGS